MTFFLYLQILYFVNKEYKQLLKMVKMYDSMIYNRIDNLHLITDNQYTCTNWTNTFNSLSLSEVQFECVILQHCQQDSEFCLKACNYWNHLQLSYNIIDKLQNYSTSCEDNTEDVSRFACFKAQGIFHKVISKTASQLKMLLNHVKLKKKTRTSKRKINQNLFI